MPQNIEEGNQFKRNETIHTVVYQNDHIVLLQYGDNNHRLESRGYFTEAVSSGHFEPQQEWIDEELTSEESDSDDAEAVPFEEISWVGEKAATALRGAGYRTPQDIRRASDEALLDCQSVGETAVENIREWVENNE